MIVFRRENSRGFPSTKERQIKMSHEGFETGEMFLVYRDSEGKLHKQHWSDIIEVGTLFDAETEEDMDIVGWVIP